MVRKAYSGSAEGSRERLRRSSSGLLHAELEQFGAIILEADAIHTSNQEVRDAILKKKN